MLTVALTGGYATGKSFVGSEFERLGCKLISDDALGHQALLPAAGGYQATVALFGRSILDANGAINRRKLGDIAFADPEKLRALNAIVHPEVYRMEAELTAAYVREDPAAIVITEAAILIETGRYKTFDRVLVTVCSLETQIARGLKRDHLTREQVLARIGRQMPSEEKQRYADYVIETERPKTETVVRLREIYEELRALAQRPREAAGNA